MEQNAPVAPSLQADFASAAELLITAFPKLTALILNMHESLASDGSTLAPLTIHDLISDPGNERSKKALAEFNGRSESAAYFARCLKESKANVDKLLERHSQNETGAAQEPQQREALIELGAYLSFVAWASYRPHNRIAQNLFKHFRGALATARYELNPAKVNFLTELGVQSLVQDKRSEELERFTQEWRLADDAGKAAKAIYMLDLLLQINSPKTTWKSRSKTMESNFRNGLEAFGISLLGVTTLGSSEAVAYVVRSLKKFNIRKKIDRTLKVSATSATTTGDVHDANNRLIRFVDWAKHWSATRIPKTAKENANDASSHPGVHIPSIDYDNKNTTNDLRDSDGKLIVQDEPPVNPGFWNNLLRDLSGAKDENEKMQILLAAVRPEQVIPTPEKVTDEATRDALRIELLPLFADLKEKHFRSLTDSACGRLLNIKHKFRLPFPDDYEFAQYGRLDPYQEQLIIDRMKTFVGRIEQKMGSDGPAVMQHLKLHGSELSKIPDEDKQKLLEILIQECAAVNGLVPPPRVRYDPNHTRGAAATFVKIPSEIVFGRAPFEQGPLLLMGIVAHEVEHATHFNLKWRINSKQSFSPGTKRSRVMRRIKLAPKAQKYRANILLTRRTGTGKYEKVFGNATERWARVAQYSTAIWAAKPEAINPEKKGFLWQLDPTQTGGDIRLMLGQHVKDAIGVTPENLLDRPYLGALSSAKDVGQPFVPLDRVAAADAMLGDPEKTASTQCSLREINKIPMNMLHHANDAFFTSVPEVLNRAGNLKDPLCIQSNVIYYASLDYTPILEGLDNFPFDPITHDAITNHLTSLAKDLPDDLTRTLAVRKLWEKRNPKRWPSDLTLSDLEAIILPLPKKMAQPPHTVARGIEKNIGITMREVAAQFGISGKPQMPARLAMNALFKLQEPQNPQYGLLGMMWGLRNIEPTIMAATMRSASSQVALLSHILVAGLRRNSGYGPTMQEALKIFFEKEHNFQFATTPADINKGYLNSLSNVAKHYSSKMAREILIEVATAAVAGISPNAKATQQITSAIRSVPTPSVITKLFQFRRGSRR